MHVAFNTKVQNLRSSAFILLMLSLLHCRTVSSPMYFSEHALITKFALSYHRPDQSRSTPAQPD
jgi:hypothetical protein